MRIGKSKSEWVCSIHLTKGHPSSEYYSPTGKSLLGKFKKAQKGRDEHKAVYQGLTATLPPDLITAWGAAEAEALTERGDALKIYQVRENSGRSQ
ncbi:MAG: hypothetical protein QOE33_3673 [Acidobacteriota bacterium]|nr:hypothetical protein [Acidobacteriota bacterium]